VYSQIVVPLDGSDMAARAIEPARALAQACASPIVAVTCIGRDEPEADRVDHIRRQLAAAAAPDAELRVLKIDGPVAAAIVEVLEDEPGSLVVMASVAHPRTAPIVGSVSEELLGAISQPVLLVGPEVDTATFELTGPVLVAVDGSDTSESILPLAGAWALAFGLQPWVVTVIDRDSADQFAAAGAGGGDVGSETGYVHRVALKLGQDIGHGVEFDTLHGEQPAIRLAEDAADRRAALITISTHGRTGARRVALGSVAMAVVHHAPCPVLVHRPAHLPPH
jgi:nucleotide-binding universal stress UspA family protein